ncbi:tight adherence protein B [Sediminihabitans luteus]|uniref:Tight adherence protein B n=1 Tax=Sediminihabitans luteus TaxID=1138585 RepID=A0A2M9D035_9CELL|nr:hypothetical protein [Sediminihabitans luteus]PJJ77554.1 tight adherence protein B [Sediminihabitans luteus]GII98454.1 hypothetical protein Slu03_08320 [Sediminihabitans luteus]
MTGTYLPLTLLLLAVLGTSRRAERDRRVRRLARVDRSAVRWRGVRRSRRRGTPDAASALAHVASLVRAGGRPADAWQSALGVPVDAYGVPDAHALDRCLRTDGGPRESRQAAAVVAACRVSGETGAPLGGVLDAVGAALAADARAHDDREAALAGPRATVTVLTWLPLVGILLGAVLGADPTTLLDGGIGTGCLLGGIVLLCAGRAWTARLVDRARRDGAPA